MNPGGHFKTKPALLHGGLRCFRPDVLTAETNPGYYTVYVDKKGRQRHTIKPKSAIAG
jgi:hypothetical protein